MNLTCITSNDTFSQLLLIPILYKLCENWLVQAIISFILMLYIFIGIAINADIFMCSIERITSSTRKISKPSADGTGVDIIEVAVWNKTIANLTLMALGASAPEILLATIEVIGNGFEAGDLGPGAIVGAAAFNLFVITAFCIIAPTKNQSKRINAIKVFAVSAFFNVFAYVWLYMVLRVFTPDSVNITESIFTVLFFPLLVLIGYAADQNFFLKSKWLNFGENLFSNYKVTKECLEKFIKEVQKIDSTLSIEECEQLAKVYIFNHQKHSSLFYRIQAIRLLSASNSPIPQLNDRLRSVYDIFEENIINMNEKNIFEENANSLIEINKQFMRDKTIKSLAQTKYVDSVDAIIEFRSQTATVLENASHIDINVDRFGNLDKCFDCEVETLDRTAVANRDFIAIKQIIHFDSQQHSKIIRIKILNNNGWTPNRMFLVKLNLLKSSLNITKGDNSIMQITIIDNYEPGMLEFVVRMIVVSKADNKVTVPVIRCQGSDRDIQVKWKTIDASAKNGNHFYGGEGELVFIQGNTKQNIEIPLVNHMENRDDCYFEIVLFDATNGASIGKLNRIMITVTNDQNYDQTMKKIMSKLDYSKNTFQLNREQWFEQIKDAFHFDTSDINIYNQHISRTYVLHFISFNWKVVFAFLPPIKLCGGWLTFFSSLTIIGIQTTIMGDLASYFGNLIGLPDHATAITFVALGTSLPDLVASRTAARKEKYADNAIGNITGSNAFNVFLGLGLPWLIASIYHASNQTQFKVDSDNLGFSVGLFTILSIMSIALLLIRRNMRRFGNAELGGPSKYANASAALFIAIYFFYITLSVWQVSQ